jgi:hypothetical protein
MAKNATEIPTNTRSDASGESAASSKVGEYMPARILETAGTP